MASGYADYKRFDGLNPSDLVKAAKTVGCDGVMVDTAFKDGPNLFDALTLNEIRDFVALAREANMFVALAGSIKASHAEKLLEIGPDIIGVRGALCGGPDRHSKISVEKTEVGRSYKCFWPRDRPLFSLCGPRSRAFEREQPQSWQYRGVDRVDRALLAAANSKRLENRIRIQSLQRFRC